MKHFIIPIISWPRYIKKSIVIIIDVSLCTICSWFALIIQLDQIVSFNSSILYLSLISIIIGIPIFWFFGLYRTIFRHPSSAIINSILASTFIYGLLYFFIISFYSIINLPKQIGVLQPMLLFFGILLSRLSAKSLLILNYNSSKSINKINLLIYGAGEAGRQLAQSVQNSPEYKVVGFLDDNDQIHMQSLLGKTIYPSTYLHKLLKTTEINLIVLAFPSIARKQRNQIIDKLKKFKLTVKTLPSLTELINGKVSVSSIIDLNVDDLLNREEVKPDIKLLNKTIYSKKVLVTGAGGSIGSEICRQIAKLKPNTLVLLDHNEFALYQINEELKSLNKNFKIVPLLANAQDQNKLELILTTFRVDTLYHAAAYKHVPLVEENICEGVKNNVFSTIAVVKASIFAKVKNFVFISSDKAVRPTNIMGASKRISELFIQSISNENKEINTKFAIVRFGNVLLSSGSVIPKFVKQIKEGGPITLTHQDITRYFMTISEASQLVIQAGAMGKHAEVFVLEMGESVKIKELVTKMINLSGLDVKDDKNPYGDIEIKIIGLRPGEKLYEELLIDEKSIPSKHENIFYANEEFINENELEKLTNVLELHITNFDLKKTIQTLEQYVSGFKYKN